MDNHRRMGCAQGMMNNSMTNSNMSGRSTMNCNMMRRSCADRRDDRQSGQNCNQAAARSNMGEKGSCQKGKQEEKTILENLPLAMGYVPSQQSIETFDTCKALRVGTIFPVLCKPFCGRAGGRR